METFKSVVQRKCSGLDSRAGFGCTTMFNFVILKIKVTVTFILYFSTSFESLAGYDTAAAVSCYNIYPGIRGGQQAGGAPA